ncbi:MAG: response regulator transcription factor [Nocardioidaceae bacterium]
MARILCIDDEAGVRQLLERVLEKPGHQVSCAPTALDGLRRATEEVWDLILLDLMLPDLAGSSVLSAILDRNPEQRVLVLSAVEDPTMRSQCLERGAVDYLTKPFAVRELLARVNARLQSSRTVQTRSGIHVDGLYLDINRRRLEIGDRTVDLTQREFLLVQLLMDRPGVVCSREDLLREVWGMDFDPGSNVVDVTVRRLRMKLGTSHIETIRNVGYALVV